MYKLQEILVLQTAVKLTDIKGVGKKNEQLLLASGYTDIPAVREYFLEQCRKNQELFRQHLQACP